MKYNLFIGDRVLYRYSVDGQAVVGRVRWIDRKAGLVEVDTNILVPHSPHLCLVTINSIESWQPIADDSKLHSMFYMAIISNRAISEIHKRHKVRINSNVFKRLYDRKMNWLNTY